MTMIRCVNLSKTYGKEKSPALSELNIEVAKNTVYGFLGPNGAGKTTTVKILTGLMRPTSGEFFISGIPNNINSVSLRRKIGYLGQEHKMYGGMKAKQLLTFVGEIFGQSKQERVVRADELLAMAGLTDAANKKISEFSGGMVQRLGIAQALMGNPEVLFLDEPTSALDPIGRKEVLEIISTLRESCTVFMSTHILSDVERVCDTVAILNKGKLIVQEKTGTLKKRFSEKLIEIEFTKTEDVEIFKSKFSKSQSSDILKVENNSILIHPANLTEDKSGFLQIIAESGLEIEKFEVKSATLEDVFVKLIGDESHE